MHLSVLGQGCEAWPRMVLQGSMEDKMVGSISVEQYRSGLMLLESTTRYNYEDAFVEQIFGKPISLSSPTEDLRIAVLYTGSVEDQAEAVALLISLARDNDRYRKSIIEEGSVGPLLKW